jgi:photosystem II stability/assembly factor-like uncharacterized protein
MSVLFRPFVSFGMVVFGASASFAQSGWFWQNPLPQGNHLGAVAVSDSQTATAVGDYGTILRTSDGGATWTLQGSGTSKDLRGVSFVDSNTATAVGGGETQPPFTPSVILRTTDGGATWANQLFGMTNFLVAVSLVDANTGTGVGDSILRTTDAGAHWRPQASRTSNFLRGVSCVNVNTCTAVGNFGTILRTNTGGE